MTIALILYAAAAIKEAFKTFAVSIGKAAVAISFLAAAFEAIEQEEARQRVLRWEGIWLWK